MNKYTFKDNLTNQTQVFYANHMKIAYENALEYFSVDTLELISIK